MGERFWLEATYTSKIDAIIKRQREGSREAQVTEVGEEASYYAIDGFEERYRVVFDAANELLNPNFVERLFGDFERFDFANVPSANLRFQSGNDRPEQNRFLVFENVNLLDHIFRVTEHCIKMARSRSERRTLMIYALLHDAGKSLDLRGFYGINADKHELASADYARQLKKHGYHVNVLTTFADELERKMDIRNKNPRVSQAYKDLTFADKMARQDEQLAAMEKAQ